MTALEFIEPEPTTDNPSQTGTLFAVLSIACFIFLVTFWIAISGASASSTLCFVVAGASILALLLGAIFGIVGTVAGKKASHGSTLVMGLIGLCLNGLFLVGMVLITLIATVATIVRLHQPRTQSQPPTQVSSQQSYSQTNFNLTQNNLRMSVTPSAAPTRIYYQPSHRSVYPQTIQAPYIPQPLRPLSFPQPLRPIYVPPPPMIITPMGMRRF